MLYAGNDSDVDLLGVIDQDGNYLKTGTITCAITDPTGNAVATVTLSYLGTPVTIGNQTYADGNWRGVLSGTNNPALIAGSTYKLVFSCSSPVLSITRYETAQTRLG